MKPKLVKFKNGKYGIRKWTFLGYEYKDLGDNEWWWQRTSIDFKECLGSREKAEQQLNILRDAGTVVREKK